MTTETIKKEVKVNVPLRSSVHKKLKIVAINNDIQLQELIELIGLDFLAKLTAKPTHLVLLKRSIEMSSQIVD